MDDESAPRIRSANMRKIREAALDVFAAHGFRGATLDQIAAGAGLSKQNLLYYFPGKEAIHADLLERLLDQWLEPLRALNADGDPLAEILAYVRRKLEMSRDYPRESRLFANEILRGAPQITPELSGHLKGLVDEKAAVIAGWMKAGALAKLDPHHLIFSIWASTQHYSDFDVQVRAVLGAKREARRFAEADSFLEGLYARALRP